MTKVPVKRDDKAGASVPVPRLQDPQLVSARTSRVTTVNNERANCTKVQPQSLWGPLPADTENGLFLKLSPRLSSFQRIVCGVHQVSPALSPRFRFWSEGASWGPEVEAGGQQGLRAGSSSSLISAPRLFLTVSLRVWWRGPAPSPRVHHPNCPQPAGPHPELGTLTPQPLTALSPQPPRLR